MSVIAVALVVLGCSEESPPTPPAESRPAPAPVEPEIVITGTPSEAPTLCRREGGLVRADRASAPVQVLEQDVPLDRAISAPIRVTLSAPDDERFFVKEIRTDPSTILLSFALASGDGAGPTVDFVLEPNGSPYRDYPLDPERTRRFGGLDPHVSRQLGGHMWLTARLSEDRDPLGCRIPTVVVESTRVEKRLVDDEWTVVRRGQRAFAGDTSFIIGEDVHVMAIDGCHSNTTIEVREADGEERTVETDEAMFEIGGKWIEIGLRGDGWSLIRATTSQPPHSSPPHTHDEDDTRPRRGLTEDELLEALRRGEPESRSP